MARWVRVASVATAVVPGTIRLGCNDLGEDEPEATGVGPLWMDYNRWAKKTLWGVLLTRGGGERVGEYSYHFLGQLT